MCARQAPHQLSSNSSCFLYSGMKISFMSKSMTVLFMNDTGAPSSYTVSMSQMNYTLTYIYLCIG